jgi:phosphoribosylaminoimidazole-succinocarboxamide synthase
MTSVKQVRVDEPLGKELGRGAFVFTDDYSVFDWGKMPDPIPGKGATLCTMGAYNFELLEAAGVPTHYRGVVADGRELPLDDALDRTTGTEAGTETGDDTPTEMRIDLAEVPELPAEGGSYDYDAYHGAAGPNYLVPLEVVFRNRVGVGSSLRRRTEPGAHGLDAAEWPDRTVDLPDAVVEFSTKFEEQDRYLDREEAARIAGPADLAELDALAREVNRIVTERAEAAGLVHQDGKIECLYADGELRVADVVGTFDENRFSCDGQQVSKEVLRQHHKRSQPEWVAAVDEAKERARSEGVADWRALCDREPAPLDEDVIELAGDLYRAGTNAYLDRGVFEAPSLPAVIERVKRL